MGRVPGANIKQFLDQHSSVEIKQSDWLQTVIGTWNSQSECFISAQQGYSKNYDTGSLYSNYRRKLIIQSSCRGNGYQLSKLHYDLLQKLYTVLILNYSEAFDAGLFRFQNCFEVGLSGFSENWLVQIKTFCHPLLAMNIKGLSFYLNHFIVFLLIQTCLLYNELVK